MYERVKDAIITLCGSVRFKEEFMSEADRLTREGHVVLIPHHWRHIGDSMQPSKEDWDLKGLLMKIHSRKIEMSDRVHIINKGGYIGGSTAEEISQASQSGKEVTFMEKGSWIDGTSTTEESVRLSHLTPDATAGR